VRVFDRLLGGDGEAPRVLRARALRASGSCAHWAGELERATRLYEASLAAFETLGDELGATIVASRLGLNVLELGDLPRARALLESTLEAFRRLGSRRGEAQVLGSLGSLERAKGNLDSAVALFEKSASMAGEIGRVWWESNMHKNLAKLALDAGRIDEAAVRTLRILDLAGRTGDRQQTVFGLAFLAGVAAARGDEVCSGRLWGAIEAEEARGRVGAWEREREELARAVLDQSGPDFERARLEGLRLSLDEAVRDAVESVRG
jgi:tetratricopeptide (TPR) repeat protein